MGEEVQPLRSLFKERRSPGRRKGDAILSGPDRRILPPRAALVRALPSLFLLLLPILEARAVTFTQDIAPILYRRCISCHRPGEVAPFPLLTYADAAKRSALIAR